MHGYRAVRPRLHGFAAGALPQYTPRPLSTGPVHPPPPFLASDPSTSTPAIDSAASEADGSRVWLPELVERYARFLPPNEVALTLRLVCRATASQFRGGQHTIIRLSQPCPPAEFAAHWADVQWLRALPGVRRRQLLQLTAAAGVLDNLWLLLQAHPEHCPLALDVIVAAAEAGQAHLVPPLLELYAHQQLPQPQDIDDAAAGLGPRPGVAGVAAAAGPPHVTVVGGARLPACGLLPVLRAAAAAGERPLLQWLLELLATPATAPATAPAAADRPHGHGGHGGDGQGRPARNGAGAAGPSTSRSGGSNAAGGASCDRGGSSSSSDDAGTRPACDSRGRRGRAAARHDDASLAAAYQATAGAAADGGQEELLCWLVAHTPATTSPAQSASGGIAAAAVQPPALPRRLLERLLVAVAGGSGNAGSLQRLLLAWLQRSPPPPQLAAPPDGGEAPVNPGGSTPEAAGLARPSTQHASPNRGAHRPHAGTGAAATQPAGPPPPPAPPAAQPLSSSDVSTLLRMVAAAAASRAADWRDKVQLLESYLPPPPPPPPEPGLGPRTVHTAGTGASRPQGRGSDGGGADGRSSSRTGAITTSLAINAAVSAPDAAERLRWLLLRSRDDGGDDPLPHMTHAAKMPPASLGRDSGARSDSGDSGSGRDERASEEGLHGVSDAAAAIGSGAPPAPVASRREACRGPQAPVVVHVPDTVSLLDAARCGAAGVLGLLLPALDSAAAQAAAEEGLAEGRERTLQLMQVLAASEGRICFLQEMVAAGLQVPASPDVLVAACGSGRVEAVRWLLEHMQKRPGTPQDPASPLAPHLGTELRRDCAVAAASSGAVEVLELLRDAGMLVDLRPPHPHQQQHLQRQRQRQQQQQQQEQQELPHGAEAGGATAYGSDAATLTGQGGAVVASSDAAPGSAGSPAGCIRPNSGPQGDDGSPAAGNDGAAAGADNPSTEGGSRGPGGSESGRDCGPLAWGPELLLAAAISGCEAAVEWAVAHGCPVVDDGEPYEQVAGEEPLCLPVLRLLRRLGHGWGAPNRVFRAVLAPRYQPPLCRTPATLRLAALRWLLDSGCPVEWDWAVRVAQQPQPLLAGALADTVASWVLREAAARGFEVAPRLELRHADGG